MNFSAFSIKHPIPAILLFILLSIAGLLAFKAEGVQDFPGGRSCHPRNGSCSKA